MTPNPTQAEELREAVERVDLNSTSFRVVEVTVCGRRYRVLFTLADAPRAVASLRRDGASWRPCALWRKGQHLSRLAVVAIEAARDPIAPKTGEGEGR